MPEIYEKSPTRKVYKIKGVEYYTHQEIADKFNVSMRIVGLWVKAKKTKDNDVIRITRGDSE